MFSTEMFIEKIKKYECLYDVSNRDYKNMPKKHDIWEEIAKYTHLSASVCKTRWKGLRDTYKKHKRKASAELPSSKCGTCSSGKKWKYMDAMSFLENFPNSRSTTIDYGTFVESDDTFFQEQSPPKLENFKDSQSTIENVTLVANDDDFLEEESLNKDDVSTQESDASEHIQHSKSAYKRKTYDEITDVFTKMMREYVDTVREIAFSRSEHERSSMSLVLELVGKRLSDAKLSKAAVMSIENKILKLVDEEIQKYQAT